MGRPGGWGEEPKEPERPGPGPGGDENEPEEFTEPEPEVWDPEKDKTVVEENPLEDMVIEQTNGRSMHLFSTKFDGKSFYQLPSNLNIDDLFKGRTDRRLLNELDRNQVEMQDVAWDPETNGFSANIPAPFGF